MQHGIISHLVIPCTQLISCEECFLPAPPQEVVILLPTFIQFYLFELRISELSVNKNQKHLLNNFMSRILVAFVYKLQFSLLDVLHPQVLTLI